MGDERDFKATLQLPTTAFAQRADFAQLEPALLARWEREGTFEAMLAQNEGAPRFDLHDGPPYANGPLHAGHALNKILKDIIIKQRNLAGERADFIPGWDCHGLPIEQAVERELRSQKQSRRAVSREAFIERCRAFALASVETQEAGFKRMGVFARWAAKYRTLDPSYVARELRVLAQLARTGALERRLQPVLWCVADQTALALAEVDSRDVEVPSSYVAFAVTGSLAQRWSFLEDKQVSLVIWTTTPWSLPANRAVSVHPDLEYCFYELHPGRVVVVAKALLPQVLTEFASNDLQVRDVTVNEFAFNAAVLTDPMKVLGYALGEELDGVTCTHPLDATRSVPVVMSTHVTDTAGTGLVHLAPAHGPDDFEVGVRCGLSLDSPVNGDGTYAPSAGPALAGISLFEANTLIPELLAKAGALLNAPGDTTTVSTPHSWRSRKPVIYRVTPQWSLRLEHAALRTQALAQVDQHVRWVPESSRERLRSMLEARPDWTLSRQRMWGTPIPAAVCGACQHVELDPALIERVADVVAREGSGAWLQHPLSAFRPEGDRCPKCGAAALEPEHDILDVWFDAACSFMVLHEPGREGPASLVVEGTDQHRGWFQSALLVSVATGGAAPWRTCLTHGFVLDGKGVKMSKSDGNTVSPDEVIARVGAEVLRLWVATSDVRHDVRLSWAIIDGLAEGHRKVRNTLRFALSNLFDFDPARDAVDDAQLLAVDQWVLARLDELRVRVTAAYEAFAIHTVFPDVLEFCASTLSAQYFDLQKDPLYADRPDSLRRRAAQTVLWRLVRALAVLVAPVLSFTAEDAWSHLPGAPRPSVFLDRWPARFTPPAPHAVADLDALFAVRAKLLPALEVARREGRLGSAIDAKVRVHTSGETHALLARHLDALSGLFNVGQLELMEGDWHVEVAAPDGQRCPRCRAWRGEVETAGVCARCADALAARAG